jgi:hypothetical protein
LILRLRRAAGDDQLDQLRQPLGALVRAGLLVDRQQVAHHPRQDLARPAGLQVLGLVLVAVAHQHAPHGRGLQRLSRAERVEEARLAVAAVAEQEVAGRADAVHRELQTLGDEQVQHRQAHRDPATRVDHARQAGVVRVVVVRLVAREAHRAEQVVGEAPRGLLDARVLGNLVGGRGRDAVQPAAVRARVGARPHEAREQERAGLQIGHALGRQRGEVALQVREAQFLGHRVEARGQVRFGARARGLQERDRGRADREQALAHQFETARVLVVEQRDEAAQGVLVQIHAGIVPRPRVLFKARAVP